MNWGSPFIIAFIILLIASATELTIGAVIAASNIAVDGICSLVVGIALQIASYVKYGEVGTASPPAAAPESITVRVPSRLQRRTKVAAVATVSLIVLAAVVIGYPALLHQGPVSVGAGSSVSSSGSSSSASTSGCGGARSDGTVFISTNATVSIEICGKSFLVQAGAGGGLTYSYHAGLVNFTAPNSVNGSAFEFWYVIVGSNAATRLSNATLSLNSPPA